MSFILVCKCVVKEALSVEAIVLSEDRFDVKVGRHHHISLSRLVVHTSIVRRQRKKLSVSTPLRPLPPRPSPTADAHLTRDAELCGSLVSRVTLSDRFDQIDAKRVVKPGAQKVTHQKN